MAHRDLTQPRGAMERSCFAAALGVAACLGVGTVTPVLANLEPVPFAGGPAGGFYQEVVEGVAAAVAGVEPRETKGSEDNLDLLAKGDVRFVLAQQDVVSEYFRGLGQGSKPSEQGEKPSEDGEKPSQDGEKPSEDVPELHAIRVVGRVFFDYLHIFVRSPLHVERASDFRLFRIWPGADGSGTRRTSERFLESVGVPLSPLLDCRATDDVPSPKTIEDAQELFASRKLDIAMIVAVPGSDQACKFMASGRASLFSLDYETLRILISETEAAQFQRQISIANVPARTYDHQAQAVPTVAVAVLLLAREGENPEVAARVLKAARHTWSSLAGSQGAAGCGRLNKLPHSRSLAEANLEMLEGFEVPDSLWQAWSLRLVLALVAAALAAGGVWLWRSGLLREGWRLLREERAGARILGGLALGAGLITFLTYIFEHRINEHFSTPWESAWSITIYLFSGLEDRNPYTPQGRVVAALGLVLGPAFFALMTGWLAGVFIRWEKRMPRNLRDHYLILNWSERAVRIIRELHHPVIRAKKGTSVVVVLTDDESLDLRKVKQAGSGRDDLFEDFYLSVGDPTDERALLNANAQDAEAILVLADDRLGAHADERSLRSLFMLRRIVLAEQDRRRTAGKEPLDLHVVVELVDEGNVAILEELSHNFPGTLEWVSGLEVRTRLIAQAALSKGVVSFYTDLLRVSDDTSEVYALPVPDRAVGESFRAFAARLLAAEVPREADGKTNPAIAVGVQRKANGCWHIHTNPQPDGPGWILQQGDRVVLLAYEYPEAEDLP